MLRFLGIKLKTKSRKYPIKRDEYGRTARQRAFAAFQEGKRPAEVSRMAGIRLSTACRYFADWKKLPANVDIRYKLLKVMRKSDGEFSEKTIRMLATNLGMPEEEVIDRLHKPWGLKQLLMGEWPNYAREERQSERERRLQAALNLINFIEHSGMELDKIKALITKLIDEACKTKTD